MLSTAFIPSQATYINVIDKYLSIICCVWWEIRWRREVDVAGKKCAEFALLFRFHNFWQYFSRLCEFLWFLPLLNWCWIFFPFAKEIPSKIWTFRTEKCLWGFKNFLTFSSSFPVEITKILEMTWILCGNSQQNDKSYLWIL